MVVSLALDPEHGTAGVHARQVFGALKKEKVEQRFLAPSDFELDEEGAKDEQQKVSQSAQSSQLDKGLSHSLPPSLPPPPPRASHIDTHTLWHSHALTHTRFDTHTL